MPSESRTEANGADLPERIVVGANGALHDLCAAVELADQRTDAHEVNPDGTVAEYTLSATDWNRIVAIARGSKSEAAERAIAPFRAALATQPLPPSDPSRDALRAAVERLRVRDDWGGNWDIAESADHIDGPNGFRAAVLALIDALPPTTPEPSPTTEAQEAFLAATFDNEWMLRPVDECRAMFRAALQAEPAPTAGETLTRDSNRIGQLVEVLRAVWDRNPDWRLGQLISNACPKDVDVFYVEDDVWERRLRLLLAEVPFPPGSAVLMLVTASVVVGLVR